MIRLAKENDLEAIYKLGQLVNENFKNTYHVLSYLENDSYIILVSENERVDGLMIIYKNIDYYELELIVVDVLCRRKGIGSSLLNYFLENFTQNNDEVILEVASKNEKAINLYKGFDFKVIGVREKYYQNDDAYIMKKVIN